MVKRKPAWLPKASHRSKVLTTIRSLVQLYGLRWCDACSPSPHLKAGTYQDSMSNPPIYGKLDEELYMEFPEGFLPPNMKGKVLRLLCAIYSLKQAGLAWWCALDKSMQEVGFERLKRCQPLCVLWNTLVSSH